MIADMRNLIKEIITHKTPCYFISPHLDDAAISCGGLISALAQKTQVYVINVFTKVGPLPYTKSAKKFLKNCGYKNAQTLFKDRVLEDRNVFKLLKVKVFYLGFIDALWRRRKRLNAIAGFLVKYLPEITHVYPTYRFHIKKGKLSKEDRPLMDSLKIKLTFLIKKRKEYIIFCPLGTGKHSDHLIVRNVCNDVFDKVVYWSDAPYNLSHKDNLGFLTDKKVRSFIYRKRAKIRVKAVKGYKSQVRALFPDGKIRLKPEKYFWVES